MRLIFYILFAVLLLIMFSQSLPLQKWLLQTKNDLAAAEQQKAAARSTGHLTIVHANLRLLLTAQPSFARVRAALIRTGISRQGGAILQWDIVEEVANEGHIPGEMVVNRSLDQWSDFLGPLLNNECVYMEIKNITHAEVQQRMQSLHMVAFLSCPIIDKKSQLTGALFASWDHTEDIPTNLDAARASLQKTATRIGILINPHD